MDLTKLWAGQLDDYVIDLSWSADSSLLAAASSAGPVALFADSDGVRQHELPGHEGGTNCAAFASRGLALATGGQDGAVKLWDATSGQHTHTAPLGRAWVENLAWRPRVERVVPNALSDPAAQASSNASSDAAHQPSPLLAACAGRQLFLLGPDGTIRRTCPDAQKTLSAVAWEPSGGCVAAAGFGGVRLWDADDPILQKEFAYGNGIHALTWSPDGKWLVSGNQDPSVHLWIPAEEAELHMSGYEGKVKHVAFDHTSRWLATSGGRDACIWDCSGTGPEGREPIMLPHDTPVCAVAFQHRHGLLATAAQDGTVMLWSVDRKQPLRATVKMPIAATKLAWSPDDRLLAIGSEKGIVYVLLCHA